ncbi:MULTISPECIES: tetratricopeptide repeat protein [Xenorhabdus]|uniref:tetratricopeptide repeat protein n=1 Tax=Xenorhabdus TaxID=626 RepID=UPI00069A6AE6|nr:MULTISPECIES: tetratricopeptide repeat protein [Xenorhabdus]WFQ80832.1 tetratricopeptide repeat protein [Xenorhabdus sp. SF857]
MTQPAEKGESEAQNAMGYLYMEGLGVSKDGVIAMEWLMESALQGNTAAQNNIGQLYWYGNNGVERDQAKAMQWFLKSVALGDDYAHLNLGMIYERGQIVPQDYEKALGHYQQAASKDVPNLESRIKELKEKINYQ